MRIEAIQGVCIMIIGKLRHRVTILRKKEMETFESFTSLTTYTEVATIWANIESTKGLVRFDTKQVGEEITHKITIRNYPLITTENWLQFRNQKFNIRFVMDADERRQYLELLCQEVFTDTVEFIATENVAGDPVSDIG